MYGQLTPPLPPPPLPHVPLEASTGLAMLSCATKAKEMSAEKESDTLDFL